MDSDRRKRSGSSARAATSRSSWPSASRLPQVETIGAVVDFVGWMPALNRRQVPDGRPVRIVVLLPVGKLPGITSMSVMISLVCESISIIIAIL